MNPESVLNKRQQRKFHIVGQIPKVFYPKIEEIVIEREQTPTIKRLPTTIYKNIADFRNLVQLPITSHGLVHFPQNIGDSEYLIKAKQAFLVDLVRMEPTFICVTKNGNVKKEYKDYCASLNPNFKADPIPDIETNNPNVTQRLYELLKLYLGADLTDKFLLAFTQDIWGTTISLLSYVVERQDEFISCQKSSKILNNRDTIIIKVNFIELTIELYSQYTGLKLMQARTARCELCQKYKEECSCTDDILIKEYLHLVFDQGLKKYRFIIDKIEISNFPPAFLTYIMMYFPAANEPQKNVFFSHGLSIEKISQYITLTNSMPIIMTSNPKLHSSLYMQNEPFMHANLAKFVNPNFHTLAAGELPTIPNSNTYSVYLGFFRIRPNISIKLAPSKNQIIKEKISFDKFSKSYSQNIFSNQESLAENLVTPIMTDALKKIMGGDIGLDALFINSFNQDMWHSTLYLLTNNMTNTLFTRAAYTEGSNEKHTLIVTLSPRLGIEIHNRYKGISYRVSNHCGVCGMQVCNEQTGDCCRDVVIEEMLELDLLKRCFVIKTIKITGARSTLVNHIYLI